MTIREVQAWETKQKIYDAALRILSKKGFKNMSIREICEAADVSIGTFYYYFESKNNILYKFYEKGDTYFKKEIKPILNSDDALENVRTYLLSYIKLVETDGADMVEHLYIPDNKILKVNRAMQEILKDIIEDGQSKKQISKKMSAEGTVKFIFVIMRGIVFDWCLYDGSYDIESYSSKFIDYITRYLSE